MLVSALIAILLFVVPAFAGPGADFEDAVPPGGALGASQDALLAAFEERRPPEGTLFAVLTVDDWVQRPDGRWRSRCRLVRVDVWSESDNAGSPAVSVSVPIFAFGPFSIGISVGGGSPAAHGGSGWVFGTPLALPIEVDGLLPKGPFVGTWLRFEPGAPARRAVVVTGEGPSRVAGLDSVVFVDRDRTADLGRLAALQDPVVDLERRYRVWLKTRGDARALRGLPADQLAEVERATRAAQARLRGTWDDAFLADALDALDPTWLDADSRLARGYLLQQRGRVEQALPHLSAALQQRPEDRSLRLLVGRLQVDLGRDEAWDTYLPLLQQREALALHLCPRLAGADPARQATCAETAGDDAEDPSPRPPPADPFAVDFDDAEAEAEVEAAERRRALGNWDIRNNYVRRVGEPGRIRSLVVKSPTDTPRGEERHAIVEITVDPIIDRDRIVFWFNPPRGTWRRIDPIAAPQDQVFRFRVPDDGGRAVVFAELVSAAGDVEPFGTRQTPVSILDR